jgi:hypothetical protein
VGLLAPLAGVLLFGSDAWAAATPTATPTTAPTATPTPGDLVDHYKVYGLQPEVVSIPNVAVEDQFGMGFVNLTNLGKLGVPVSKAIAPELPSGVLLRPFEHLTWYEFSEPRALQTVQVTNQFGTEIWDVKDGGFLLVPAEKDGQPGIELGQHWKCYDAFPHSPTLGLAVNLQDQFHLEEDVAVGPGRYLCNPAEKNFEGPPPLPEQHLACYEILQRPLGELHFLADQFGPHDGFVEEPELLCLPSQKFYSGGPDFDSDGVADALDNCSEDVNPAQDDTDLDDCGNVCDCDYDQSGVCGFPDFGAFVRAFGWFPPPDEEKCHNEPIPGGIVGFPDFGSFVSMFGSAPGPSGTTAGTTACP